nr:hypothetical protein [Fournierella massiliensis]
MTGDFIDAVAFTGHKGLLGPQGTGGLVLAEGLEQGAVRMRLLDAGIAG